MINVSDDDVAVCDDGICVVVECNYKVPDNTPLPTFWKVQGHSESILLLTACLTWCSFQDVSL